MNSKLILLYLLGALSAHAQGTAFTYQGRLNGNGTVANGSYDLRFAMFDHATAGNAVGTVQTTNAVAVNNGLFTVTLDFGPGAFNGADRWLFLSVKSTSEASFTPLAPRQKITAAPYAVTAANLSGMLAPASFGGTYSNPVTLNNSANVFAGSGTNLTNLNAASLTGSVPLAALTSVPAGNLTGTVPAAALGNAWRIGGNTGPAGTLGTLDAQPLAFVSANSRVLSLETRAITSGLFDTTTAVNVLGGSQYNTIASGVTGATISGGGSWANNAISASYHPNSVSDEFGTVSGGLNNTAGSADGNTANSRAATVAGGEGNVASGSYSFIGGGHYNMASGSNSFAAGNQAKASHNGSFVWADSQAADFASTAPNQFNVRAAGGLRLSGNGGTELMTVDSSGQLSAHGGIFAGPVFTSGSHYFGAQVRQMLNLWSTEYGIGVQGYTLYCRAAVGGGFAWHMGGVHSDTAQDPGAGGQRLMGLTTGGLVVNGNVNGVQGTSSNGSASGVYGQNDGGGFGVAGRTTGTGSAVFGDNTNPGGWAGNFNGRVYVGGDLTVNGTSTTKVLTITGGADIAEPFKMSGKDLPKGAVVVIDENNPGHLKLSESAYDSRVAGIISGANGVNPGISLSQQGVMEGDQNVALSGRVYVQADADTGSIKPGDLLTTSAIPGHAMKAGDHTRSTGAILGKAMTSLAKGRGMVLVLVSLQ